MEMRVFGRTGMQLSVLGFGCGAVGGLMVRGDPVARATATGVNYFDTAVQYGNGESEKNLGRPNAGFPRMLEQTSVVLCWIIRR